MNAPGQYVIAYRSPLEAWLWESGILWWVAPPFVVLVLIFIGWAFVDAARRQNGWRRRK